MEEWNGVRPKVGFVYVLSRQLTVSAGCRPSNYEHVVSNKAGKIWHGVRMLVATTFCLRLIIYGCE